jgi:type I restriction enzyme S subunit
MSEWETKRLEDVIDLRRGFDLPTRERRKGPYPVLSAGVTAGWHDEARVEGPGFVVGRATNLGVPTWTDVDYWPLNTTLYAADFRGNEPRYLYHLFETLDLTGYDSGSVQPMLNRNYIAGLQVRVAPLVEQRAIADVLRALDDKIAANTKSVKTADQLAGALTRRSTDPTETVALSDVALITMGSSPPGASYNESGDGTVFYQGVRDFGVRYPRNRVWTTEPVRLAQKFDCLVSVRAPVGELNLAGEETCIGRGLASVRSTENMPMSLFHILRDLPDVWASYEAEGTVFGSINKRQLAWLKVPTVQPEYRPTLEGQLSGLELRIAAAIEESDQLAATRDALLPQLMSGRIRVKDVEKRVEEVL